MSKVITIPTHDPVIGKIQDAIDSISNMQDKVSIELSFSELSFIRRLLWQEEAVIQILFDSMDDKIKKQKQLKAKEGEI